MGPDDKSERDELEPTAEELAEAAALAAALDDGRAHEELPTDAWQAALLLRHVAASPDVPEAGKLALDLARRRRRLRLRAVTGVLALAATVLLVIGVTSITSHGGAFLPRPSQVLLEAQMNATGGKREDVRRLEIAMRSHRKVMLRALAERYGDAR